MTNRYDEETLRKLYLEENLTPEEIAVRLDLPLRGTRSKLGAMKIYKKKVYVTKAGTVPVKKRDLIQKLIPRLGLHPALVDSLEKVNKVVLLRLIELLEEKTNIDSEDK